MKIKTFAMMFAAVAATAVMAEFKDPEGNEIMDPVVVDWLSENGFTQADIDGLGGDSAATDKLYECWLLNCDFTVQDAGGALSITGIAVSNGVVSVTEQLVRSAPLGYINGELYLYGADDLAEGFYVDPISNEIIDFGDGDPFFDTEASGLVTQSVTATIDTSYVTEKFFKAVIGSPQTEDPWEGPGEEE